MLLFILRASAGATPFFRFAEGLATRLLFRGFFRKRDVSDWVLPFVFEWGGAAS